MAAISFSVPAYRFGPRKNEFTEAIVDAARRISEKAGPTLEKYPNYDAEEARYKRAKTR